MAKSIAGYKNRESVVRERLRNDTGGLGFWAAMDARKHIKGFSIIPSKEDATGKVM